MAHYEYDKEKIRFRKVTRTLWGTLRSIGGFLLVSLSLSALYYVIFASLFSTDTERELRRENRLFEKLYPEMEEKVDLIGDVVDGLELRDSEIYTEIFSSSAPSLSPLTETDPLESVDSLLEKGRVEDVDLRAEALLGTADKIEDNFQKVFSRLASSREGCPPLAMPLKNFSYARTGASVGQKLSPYYKVIVPHNGIDLIASQGEGVYATADGVVSVVDRSSKGLGNMVEIKHSGGYVTRYAHLVDVSVSQGQRVKAGRKLGAVGMSGNSFAPHLHYEVLKDGQPVDPVNCFFASMDADQYVRVMYLSSITGQSLD